MIPNTTPNSNDKRYIKIGYNIAYYPMCRFAFHMTPSNCLIVLILELFDLTLYRNIFKYRFPLCKHCCMPQSGNASVPISKWMNENKFIWLYFRKLPISCIRYNKRPEKSPKALCLF